MGNKGKYFAGSFLWGTGAKLLDATIKFLAIPLLLGYFGKENYGLLTLALATNAYMQLLDMGMNTGGIKFFAQWIASGKHDLIDRVARTNITFYLMIGSVNSLVLIILATWGSRLFNITATEFDVFKSLLYILSAFSIINWITFVFNQLLIADEKMIFTQQMLMVKSFLGLAVIAATILLEWSILQYFFCYLLINSLIVLPYYLYSTKQKLICGILPAFYWKDSSVVFKYGLTILAMSMFQFTASQSRPLILGIFTTDGIGILSEYRIIEVFPLFIISLGGMLINILLPKTSKAIQNNDRATIEKLAYEGTLYTSILVSLLCFPIILIAGELITLYVGVEYAHLSVWLSLWIFTLTLYLHNSPISSLVLATGRTKMLVYSSAIACIISIVINILLINIFGVGSAVIGYMVYVIIQMSFYYLYFNRRVLELDSLKIFKSFIIPTGLSFLAMVIVMLLPINVNNHFFMIGSKVGLWTILFTSLLAICKVIDFSELLSKVN